MPTVFTPAHKSMYNLFEPGTTYSIPPYQRPYSWQALGKSDRNNQVNQMWDDLWGFFADKTVQNKEYFFGSMVLINQERSEYEVVDGQQRLTTATLLFAAMRCFLREEGVDPDMKEFVQSAISTLEGYLYNREGVGLVRHLKVKIVRDSGYSYQHALAAAIDCKGAVTSDAMTDEERGVAARYVANRDFFIERLREEFLDKGRLTLACAERFEKFFTFVSHRVSFVLIHTTDLATAYSIFEILNNRGLPLTGRDLLRNFLIRELTAAEYDDPPAAWFRLERDYGLTEEFIGRWVESTKGQQQRYSAFNGAVELYRDKFSDSPGRPKRAVQFLQTIEKDLGYYRRIDEPEEHLTSVRVRHKIRAILSLGNERYSVDLMLALFRLRDYHDGDDAGVLTLLTAYQRWVWYIYLTPGARFPTSPVFKAIRQLQGGDLHAARKCFDLPAEGQINLRKALDANVEDHEVARLLLATYTWAHVEQDVATLTMDLQKATLEHICPQQPESGSNWLSDFSPSFRLEFLHKLGNMTLLTHKMNSGAKNRGFAYKRDNFYRKTALPLTVEFVALDRISEAFVRERHRRIVDVIADELGL